MELSAYFGLSYMLFSHHFMLLCDDLWRDILVHRARDMTPCRDTGPETWLPAETQGQRHDSLQRHGARDMTPCRDTGPETWLPAETRGQRLDSLQRHGARDLTPCRDTGPETWLPCRGNSKGLLYCTVLCLGWCMCTLFRTLQTTPSPPSHKLLTILLSVGKPGVIFWCHALVISSLFHWKFSGDVPFPLPFPIGHY